MCSSRTVYAVASSWQGPLPAALNQLLQPNPSPVKLKSTVRESPPATGVNTALKA
jgi:hypothetical protein